MGLEQPDFRAIFEEKLASIKPLSEEDGKNRAWELRELGVGQIKRVAVSVILPLSDKTKSSLGREYAIWIEDPKNINNKIDPHPEVDAAAKEYIQRFAPNLKTHYFFASTFYEDIEGKRMFSLSPSVQNALNVKEIDEITRRYEMDILVGEFEKFKDAPWIIGRKVICADLLGRLRENDYKYDLAEQYNMTWSEFMRMRLLSADPLYIQHWGNLENVARMIKGLPYQGPRMMQEERTGD